MLSSCLIGQTAKFNPFRRRNAMKSSIFFIMLFFMMNQAAFSADYSTPATPSTTPENPPPGINYPAIKISSKLAQQIFFDAKKRLFNCPVLFDNSITFPGGTSIALCEDAQLACLRYGLLLKEMETAKERLLEELKRTLVYQKQEITIRLRGCQLAIKRTLNGEDIMDAAGYASGSYGGPNLGTSSSGASSSSGSSSSSARPSAGTGIGSTSPASNSQ
jgi:hypothetical protein